MTYKQIQKCRAFKRDVISVLLHIYQFPQHLIALIILSAYDDNSVKRCDVKSFIHQVYYTYYRVDGLFTQSFSMGDYIFIRKDEYDCISLERMILNELDNINISRIYGWMYLLIRLLKLTAKNIRGVLYGKAKRRRFQKRS